MQGKQPKKQKAVKKSPVEKPKKASKIHMLKLPVWFALGILLGLFFVVSFLLVYYQKVHQNVVYPGVFIGATNVSGKTESQVRDYFNGRNGQIQSATITLSLDNQTATISGQDLKIGYDTALLSKQAIGVGRTGNVFSDIATLFRAYTHGLVLSPAYTYDDRVLASLVAPIQKAISVKPVDAVFTFQDGKVQQFRQSIDGRDVDMDALKKVVKQKTLALVTAPPNQQVTITIPVSVVKPAITTETVNSLGIQELVGTGESLFHGSIANRIYNIQLASSRLNGVLIKPGEVFSFDKALGDVSALTGFKQAYVIANGKTVLGDGGGVCQVSTTFFRAILDAGYPVLERNEHAYRVHYYEEDSGPGIDAAIYTPTVDLKFRNDSGHYLLVQSSVDIAAERLTFYLYGTKDNRIVTIGKPVITSHTPAPAPLYQDDPTLPKGQEKQIDFSADGANVYFTRTVMKDGKQIINDTFTSHYRPWQAVFLRGTKEG